MSGARVSLAAVFVPWLACAACADTPPPAAAAPSTAAPCPTPPLPPLARLHLRVTFAGGVPDAAVHGRMQVAMSSSPDVKNPFEVGRNIEAQWLAAEEVRGLAKGGAVDLDPDVLAFPMAFSRAPAGTYRIAARLVRTSREGEASLVGPVVEQALDPAHAGTVDLRLDAAKPVDPVPVDTANIKVVRVESKLLSAFYGRPRTIDAIVILPPTYGAGGGSKGRRFVTEYYIPGFGGTLQRYAASAEKGRQARIDAKYPELVRVILPGMLPTGHHVFADSVSDGPWGSALVQELIPALEKQFALIREPRARLLSGHSSGGWSSLWVQITHPDFFGGTWSTAPDPVDFRNFTTIDVTPGSTDNFFRNRDGSARMVMRAGGKDILSAQQFFVMQEVTGEVGPFGTFDWVFSPRGPMGAPMSIVDEATGEQDPVVQKAWEKWDIHKVLDAGWATLGPKLKGKLHLFAGDADSVHLNESLALLCTFLKSKGSDAVCEIVPGKDHFTLTGDAKDPASLVWRIEHEMAKVAGVK